MKLLTMRKVSLDHTGGTKSYHYASISCAESDRSILMCRWGKTGQFGSVKIQTFMHERGAQIELDQLSRTRQRSKGYQEVEQKSAQTSSVTTIVFFGVPVWTAFGGNNLDFLEADINTSGMKRGVSDPMIDENGTPIKQPARRQVEVDEAELAAKALADARAAHADNPLFGIF